MGNSPSKNEVSVSNTITGGSSSAQLSSPPDEVADEPPLSLLPTSGRLGPQSISRHGTSHLAAGLSHNATSNSPDVPRHRRGHDSASNQSPFNNYAGYKLYNRLDEKVDAIGASMAKLLLPSLPRMVPASLLESKGSPVFTSSNDDSLASSCSSFNPDSDVDEDEKILPPIVEEVFEDTFEISTVTGSDSTATDSIYSDKLEIEQATLKSGFVKSFYGSKKTRLSTSKYRRSSANSSSSVNSGSPVSSSGSLSPLANAVSNLSVTAANTSSSSASAAISLSTSISTSSSSSSSNHVSSSLKLNIDAIIDKLIANGIRAPKKKVHSLPVSQSEIKTILHKARSIFLDQPTLLKLSPPVKIVGDIHGQFHDLIRIFNACGYPPYTNYLFLGDYVDRGRQSLETFLLLLCYKIKYPENFFMLRGNHELANITKIYGFYDECKRRIGNAKIWKEFVDVFNVLPIAATINDKIFCIHGGLSPELNLLKLIEQIKRPTDIPDKGLLADLLWLDPDSLVKTFSISNWPKNDRGVLYTFGRKHVEYFCSKFDIDLIVRGHMVVEDGYEFFSKRKLVTIFLAPNYCGEFDNFGAVMSVDKKLCCLFELLKPT